MFAARCEREGVEVLLTERQIVSVEHARDEVTMVFRCTCGALGTYTDARRRAVTVAPSPPPVGAA